MVETSPREIFMAAMAAAEVGRIEDALAGFDRVAALEPSDAGALCQAGLLRLRSGQYDQAKQNFESVLQRQPENLTALFSLAETQEKLGDESGAIESFSRVLRHRPDFAPARSNLGVLHRRIGALGTAIGHFEKLTRLTPEDAQAHLLLAATCHRARMMEEALPAFRRSLILTPDNRDAVYNLAVTEPLLGRREDALRHLTWSLIQRSLSTEAYTRIGQFSARLGKSETARSASRRALCLDPQTWEAVYTLSGQSTDLPTTARYLQQVTHLSPEQARAHIELANARYADGRPDAAERGLREYLKGSSEYREDALRLLRQIMSAAGRLDAFKAEFGNFTSEYARWVAEFDDLAEKDRTRMSQEIASWENPPRFDIIMPVCDPPAEFLNAAIASVKDQVYPHWRLCIADDASTDPTIREILQRAAEDPRIEVVFRDVRAHISAASNSALELTAGDYVTFLDHDDALAPSALYWMARALIENPDLDLLYSDEDKIDEAGERYDPHFKPDWTLELLRAQNYICHLAVYRRSLLIEFGGLRVGYEGSQDHDLALRATDRSRSERIAHIPKILYHWRAIQGSSARDGAAKPYAVRAGARAVSDHLKRVHAAAEVEVNPAGFQVRWALPQPPPHVVVIIPTRDRVQLLRRAVDGVLDGTDYPGLSLMIVDNDSTEPETITYLDALEREGRARVIRMPGPFNYSAFNNAAVHQSDAPLLCFLNNDTEPKVRGWLAEMVSHALRDDVGVVGAKLLYPDDTVQHAGLHLAGAAGAKHIHTHIKEIDPGYWNRAIMTQALSAVTGAAMVMRRTVFDEIGGFDGDNFPVDFSDVDLCLRAGAAGYQTIWTPHAVLYHHESASRGTFVSREKELAYRAAQKAMQERYGEKLHRDPYSNPNLDLEALDFKPAFPPRH